MVVDSAAGRSDPAGHGFGGLVVVLAAQTPEFNGGTSNDITPDIGCTAPPRNEVSTDGNFYDHGRLDPRPRGASSLRRSVVRGLQLELIR